LPQLQAKEYMLQNYVEGMVNDINSKVSFSSDKTNLSFADTIAVTWSIPISYKSASISGYGTISGNSGTVTFKPGNVSSIVLTVDTGNETVNKSIPITILPAPTLNNLCSIQLQGGSYTHYGSSYTKIELIKGDGSDFDFGKLLTSFSKAASFDNASVSTSSTWPNSDLYYPATAIKGYAHPTDLYKQYWLGEGVSTYTINLKKAEQLAGMYIADNAFYDPTWSDLRSSYNYQVKLTDCSGQTIKTIFVNKLSPGYLIQSAYLSFTK